MSDRIGSEAELIETYLAPLAYGLPGACNLIDDAAVLTVADNEELVVTTDAVAAGVHFFEDDPPDAIAWKALAVNISDLVAKGATPLAYQMALSFPEAPRHDWMAKFAEGLRNAQLAFAVTLSGGDTDRRPGPLSVTITAIGRVPASQTVRRSGGRPGDRLFVTNTLGDAALGLELRRASSAVAGWALDEQDRAFLLDRYLRPRPSIVAAAIVLEHASAAMDLSDGLAKDLGRLCRVGGTGARVRIGDLPLSRAARLAMARDPDVLERIVTGGDDYEVLAAVPPDRLARFAADAEARGLAFTEIGILTADGGVEILDQSGRAREFSRPGWDHF
ncbi:MAG: thiamine-phosphate kinase [Hyphomicrobium sp.]|nr:thiamine-phosphate kinase [Hyphomicrobium sp.]